MLKEVNVSCPYCGETFATTADPSAGSHRYIEDCQVCCAPIECTLTVEFDGSVTVTAARDDD